VQMNIETVTPETEKKCSAYRRSWRKAASIGGS